MCRGNAIKYSITISDLPIDQCLLRVNSTLVMMKFGLVSCNIFIVYICS